VAWSRQGRRNFMYSLFALATAAGYYGIASTRRSNLIVRLAKKLYEVSPLDGGSWLTIGLVCVIGSAVLVILQALRGRLLPSRKV
jgi:hypothetical protein